MNPTLLSSPLQGLTDFRFRNAFNTCFGGIDTFCAPYMRFQGKLAVKPANERDLLPENNPDVAVIPQILTSDADAFIFAATYVQGLGYQELNWNLGCSYPMVTKRGMGAGLLQDPGKINRILTKVHAESDIAVSVKMRLGYESSEESLQVLPILGKHPIKNIAVHARLGKQGYTGDVDLDAFQRCVDNTDHKLIYNGDITSVAVFTDLAKRFPKIDHWMIGRGLLADPFLPGMIKNTTLEYPENKIAIFSEFHDLLFHAYAQALSGPGHTIMKMLQLWEYFAAVFPNVRKELKKIKKAKIISAYEDAVRELLSKAKEQAPGL